MIPDASIQQVGTHTIELRFDQRIDPLIHDHVLQCADDLRAADIDGIVSVFITYHSVGVHLNEDTSTSLLKTLQTWFDAWITHIEERSSSERHPLEIIHEIPVRFGGTEGPDLTELAAYAQMSESDVVQIFCESTYRLYMTGFIGNFPYLGIVPPAIRMPRRAQPRISVVPGSVGIAAYQTGIYPVESPGGWNLIGRTEVDIPSLDLQPGDSIRFIEVRHD